MDNVTGAWLQLDTLLRRALGPDVRFTSRVLANRRAFSVMLDAPAYWNGYHFTWDVGSELPEILTRGPVIQATIDPATFNTIPANPRAYTVNVDWNIQPPTADTIGEPRIANIERTVMPTVAPPPIIMRTREQELRYHELEIIGRDSIFTEAQSEEMGTLSRMVAFNGPLPARLSVRVWFRTDYADWRIRVRVNGEDRNLPPVAVIKALLPPEHKHFLSGRIARHRSSERYFKEALAAGLPPNVLHDAIKAWLVASENQNRDVSSESFLDGSDPQTESLLRAQPATLEVAGRVYRLVPTGEVDVRPIISRTRAKALATVRVEADNLRNRAQIDSRMLVNQAEERARVIRAELESERRLAGNKVPDWIRDSGRPHMWTGVEWAVEMRVACQVTDIRLSVGGWRAILHWNPITVPTRDARWYNRQPNKMPVWVRIGPTGGYTFKYIGMVNYGVTHITNLSLPLIGDPYACCMGLQGLPPVLSTEDQLRRLEDCLSRGMQVVNLNSPLYTTIERYWPDFLAQLPKMVIKKLRDEISFEDGDRRPLTPTPQAFSERWPDITWDRVEGVEQDAEGIFSVDAPLPAPIPGTEFYDVNDAERPRDARTNE